MILLVEIQSLMLLIFAFEWSAPRRGNLLCQRMLPIIHPGEVQEFLHVAADVFPLFPDHSDLYVNGWSEGDSGDAGGSELVGHAGVKEAAVFPRFYKLQGGVDLAAAHDDVWGVAVHFEACF